MARRHSRHNQTDGLTNIVTLVVRALWLLVSWPIRLMLGKRPSRLDQAYYSGHWETIRGYITQGDAQHLQQAVVEADKLLDHAMRELHLPGSSFADRLRSAESRMSQETYQMVWQSHKLRNQIAHEVGYTIGQSEAETALMGFRRGLQSLGAL